MSDEMMGQHPLQGDLDVYKSKLAALKNDLELLDNKKQEIIREGLRIEGAIEYIRSKM